MSEIKNGSSMEEFVAGVKSFIGVGTTAGPMTKPKEFDGIQDFLLKRKERDPGSFGKIKEILEGEIPEQTGAISSIIEAFQWNLDHPDTALPVMPHKDKDGNYGVRINDDALAEYSWYRDEKTGQLKPNPRIFNVLEGGTGGLQAGGLGDLSTGGLDASSYMPWMHGHADGEICRGNTIRIEPNTKPQGKNFNIIAVPGVLTDGNGHYYDAHDLPDGMSWDGKSKSPEVAEGYVVSPDGVCMTEEAAREKYNDNLRWQMQEDGTFINNLTGETWKYNQQAADIKGRVDAMKGIYGDKEFHPLERPDTDPFLRIDDEKPIYPRVGPDFDGSKIPEGWLASLDQTEKPDWKKFGETMIGVDPILPEGQTRDKSLKTKPSEKKGLELPDIPTAKGASDGTEYGG